MVNFGGKNTEKFEEGSRIRVLSSGGGGYGKGVGKEEDKKEEGVKYIVSAGSIGLEKQMQETN